MCCKKINFPHLFASFFTLLFPFRQMLNIIFGFQASYSLNGVGMEVISLKLFILGRICHDVEDDVSFHNFYIVKSCSYDDGCVTYMQDKLCLASFSLIFVPLPFFLLVAFLKKHAMYAAHHALRHVFKVDVLDCSTKIP